MGGAAVVLIRPAETVDAEAIGRIHVEAWRAAYRSLIPDEFLASLDASERADRWRTRIGAKADPGSPTFVALDETDTVRGFANSGPLRDDDLPREGRAEIFTIYVDPAAWRQGIGSALMDAVDDFWRPKGIRELILWAFEANPAARDFYERLGYALDGTHKIDDFGGTHIAEVRFRRSIP